MLIESKVPAEFESAVMFDPQANSSSIATARYTVMSKFWPSIDSSFDGGTTWLPRRPLTALGAVSFGNIAVLAEGTDVHVVWEDETTFAHAELFHQRSSDAGLTFDFAAPKVVPGSFDVIGWDVDLAGSTLAFGLRYLAPDFGFSWTGLLTSNDRGDTYNTPASISAPTVSVDQSFEARIELVDGGAGVAAIGTASDFSGGNHVIAMGSSDGGQTWGPGVVLHSGPAKQTNVIASGPGRQRVVATWLEGFGFTGTPRVAVSTDGGVSFDPALTLASFASSTPRMAWNDLYQNALAGLVPASTPKDVTVGGLRPQAIDATGFSGGSSSVQLDLEHFDGGADLGWVLLSDNTAGLPLEGGRDLGLGLSPLLGDTLNLAATGLFAAPLSPTGAGSTGALPVPAPGLPPGLTLYAVGVGIDLATLSVVDVSDVVRLDT